MFKDKVDKIIASDESELRKLQLVILEIMKVIYPTKEQIRNAFFAVFIVVAVVSLFLALVDVIMSFVLSKVI